MQRRARILLVAAALLLLAFGADGATWRVELDGTGDFESIQDAVDAAEPGDTILVGPGRFDEYRLTPINNFSAVIYVYKSGLTVRGSGAEETIIGVEEIDWLRRIVIVAPGVQSFEISDASVVGGYDGIYYGGQGLTVERCIFRDSAFGISLFASSGFVIRESTFVGIRDSGVMDTGVMSYGAGASGGLIEDCEFTDMTMGVVIQATRGATVANCVLARVVLAIQYEQSSTGTIIGCRATGRPGNEYGIGVAIISGSRVTMTDNEIDWSMSNAGALNISNQGVVSGQGNILRGGGEAYAIRVVGPQAFQDFHGNEIYPANTRSMVAFYSVGSLIPPVHLDMTGNYWGTDDADQIAAWIEDYHDYPDHLHYRMIVDFIPFESNSIPVVSKTWSAVKGLFGN